MLPVIPSKLRRIDESTVGEHFALTAEDRCFFFWEYTRGKDFSFGPVNALVKNLKITPQELQRNPARQKYKATALNHAASALRQLIRPDQLEQLTFVPVPGSKCKDDPEFEDRMGGVLRSAFRGLNADIRNMLAVTRSSTADHRADERLSPVELLAITELTPESQRPPRRIIVVVDDVLNSGKHFRVAKTLLTNRFPGTEIRGLFMARIIGANPFDT